MTKPKSFLEPSVNVLCSTSIYRLDRPCRRCWCQIDVKDVACKGVVGFRTELKTDECQPTYLRPYKRLASTQHKTGYVFRVLSATLRTTHDKRGKYSSLCHTYAHASLCPTFATANNTTHNSMLFTYTFRTLVTHETYASLGGNSSATSL